MSYLQNDKINLLMKIALWLLLIILETISIVFLQYTTFHIFVDKNILVNHEMIPSYYQDITLLFRFLASILIFVFSNIFFVRKYEWHFISVAFFILCLTISTLWSNFFTYFIKMSSFTILIIILNSIPFLMIYSFSFMREGRRID